MVVKIKCPVYIQKRVGGDWIHLQLPYYTNDLWGYWILNGRLPAGNTVYSISTDPKEVEKIKQYFPGGKTTEVEIEITEVIQW